MSGKEKDPWDTCATAHFSLSGKQIAVVSTMAAKKGVSQSKIVQMMLLESSTFNEGFDELVSSGLFGGDDSHYEIYKKRKNFLKKK